MSLLDATGPEGPSDGPVDVDAPLDPAPGAGDAAPEGPVGPGRWARRLDLAVVAACSLFVFWQLHPDLILAETTPAGGDMGAHVYAFAYLRDTLLPALRTSGWTQDWYAGFPIFQFYMVVPFLAMVALNTGLGGIGAVVPAAGSLALAARAGGASLRDRVVLGAIGVLAVLALLAGAWVSFGPGWRLGLQAAGVAAGAVALVRGRGSRRRLFGAAAIAVAVLGVALPYGPSFKVVSVAGVVAMPATAHLFGRLARLPRPVPVLCSVATLAFLFDTSFTIYGGNVASTMAGEFAFSISLALALAYLGVLVHGLRTGTHRATAAVLLALVGLCHLIPAFFALAATGVLLAVHVAAEPARRGPEARGPLLAGAGAALVVTGAALAAVVTGAATVPVVATWTVAALAVVALLALARHGADQLDGEATGEPDAGDARPPALGRTWWLVSTGAVAGLLAAWWVLPFLLRRTYLNDMGWEKIAVHRDGVSLWSWFSDDVAPALVPADLRVWAALALVGAVLSVVFRSRIGVSLVVLGIGLAMAFVYAPQGRLWNARLLPFWYLVVYLLAAIGIGEVIRAVAQLAADDPERPHRRVQALAAPVVFLLVAGFLAGQLRHVPGGRANDDGSYRINATIGIPGLVSVDVPDALGIDVRGRNFVTDWSRWNYSGYERKDAYPEYAGIVGAMAEVGDTRGCGMSMWEYSPDLNGYGTPMALMLLPHWTDGCIGSMEGLYFEASSTTPFHFLVQSELSAQPSRAQRDLPYRELDVDAGVEHLQLLGVRYYMARSAEANTAARAHPDLTEVAADGPWVVYEVADADVVEPLAFEPAVTTAGQGQHEWLCSGEDENGRCTGPALDWFQDRGARDVALAATGPAEWQRVDPGETPDARPVPVATVSDVVETDDSISFTVDRPGTPVLVKASYFPNWRADGARGPYRVAPNLMVVVPTDTEVTLRYARTPVDLVALALSLVGVVALVGLARRPRVRVRSLADAPGTVEPTP